MIAKTYSLIAAALCVFLANHVRAENSRSFADPARIRYDAQCLTIDGKDTFIYSGAFHYFDARRNSGGTGFKK